MRIRPLLRFFWTRWDHSLWNIRRGVGERGIWIDLGCYSLEVYFR